MTILEMIVSVNICQIEMLPQRIICLENQINSRYFTEGEKHELYRERVGLMKEIETLQEGK